MALGGPIPDKSFPVLVYNMERADEFVNSDALVFVDRFDKNRKTITALTLEAQDAYRLASDAPQGNYGVGVVYEESNWTYFYNNEYWGLSDTFDLSQLPYTATEADPNNDSNLMVRSNASQAWVKDTISFVYPEDYIITGESEYSAAINRAISDAKATGRDVRLLGELYEITQSINLIDAKGVKIIGSGGGFFVDSNKVEAPATTIKWTGSASPAAIIRIASTQSAPSKAMSGGVCGVYLDCNGLAGRGLYCTSINSYEFIDISINEPTTTGLLMDCLDNKLNNGGSGGDPADNQNNHFDRISIKVSGTAPCIFLTGNAGDLATVPANTSLNYFGQIHLNIRDGDGFVFSFSDANTVAMLRVFRPSGNTGVGLRFNADDSGQNKHARHNILYHVQTGVASVIAAAGNGTRPSDDNAILGFSYGNSGIDNPPIIEEGATLSYISPRLTKNIASQTVSVSGANEVALATNAATQLAALGNESHRIFNTASNHSVYVDNAGNEWSVSISAVDGSFRISRISGTGKINLDSILDLSGQSISASAVAGGANALPATPSGYIDVVINGSTKKIPYFNQ